MNNSLLSFAIYSFPILAGVIAFILFSKGDFEKRIRNMLWWSVSAISVPWLFYLWRSILDTPSDVRVFGWSLLIFIPFWITWLVLVNKGEKYVIASRLVLLACMLPIYVYAISDWFSVLAKLFAMHEMKLFVYTSMVGMFLVFGIWVRNYKIILFRDK